MQTRPVVITDRKHKNDPSLSEYPLGVRAWQCGSVWACPLCGPVCGADREHIMQSSADESLYSIEKRREARQE